MPAPRPYAALSALLHSPLCVSLHPQRNRVAAQVLAELHGVRVDPAPATFAGHCGRGEAEFLRGPALTAGVPEASFDAAAAQRRFLQLYAERCAASTAASDCGGVVDSTASGGTPSVGCPGAATLVAACRASGLRIGLASAAAAEKVAASLSAAGLDESSFDVMITAADPKPLGGGGI